MGVPNFLRSAILMTSAAGTTGLPFFFCSARSILRPGATLGVPLKFDLRTGIGASTGACFDEKNARSLFHVLRSFDDRNDGSSLTPMPSRSHIICPTSNSAEPLHDLRCAHTKFCARFRKRGVNPNSRIMRAGIRCAAVNGFDSEPRCPQNQQNMVPARGTSCLKPDESGGGRPCKRNACQSISLRKIRLGLIVSVI